MEAPDDGVQALAARNLRHVAQRVDDPGVAAAGEHDQALAAHVRDERLVVEDELVGLPLAVAARLVAGRQALLERGGPIDLAGHEQRAVEQERGLAPLGDLEAGAFERVPARGRDQHRLAARERDPSPVPGLRVEEDGQLVRPELPDQPLHPAHVVEVAVAEHDRLDIARR